MPPQSPLSAYFLFQIFEDYDAEKPGVVEVDAYHCDMFETNATYAPNGYMRKT